VGSRGTAVDSSTSIRAAFSDSFRITKGFSARLTAGANRSSPYAANVVYGASLNYRPNGLDRYTVNLTSGDVSTNSVTSNGITAPSALTFDCNSKSASGAGPGDLHMRPTSTTLRAGWNRSSKTYRANVTVYSQVQNGTTSSVAVNASALPIAFFPSGTDYFHQASIAYSQQPGCAPVVLLPSDIYLNIPIADRESIEAHMCRSP
jgi:hypothetical protein